LRRYILTGAPGAGKTSILRLLEARGYGVIEEAATAVIARAHARGEAEPWTRASFLDEIVALQRSSQAAAAAVAADIQFFDRSPVCTYALARYLGYPVPASLSAEISRITRDQFYERHVFFIRNLGFCEPTAARRISFAESLVFERIHEDSYRGFGYQLVEIPAGGLAGRVSAIQRRIAELTGNQPPGSPGEPVRCDSERHPTRSAPHRTGCSAPPGAVERDEAVRGTGPDGPAMTPSP
jgi:predicted ATPase